MLICCTADSGSDPLAVALASDSEKIKRVMDNLERHEVQILFTEVYRDKNNGVTFTDYAFQVDDSLYFYPASTVKFPIALLALEKMHKEKRFNRNTQFFVEGDTTTTTFAREIEKIFAVSDNAAYNRLFEYLGQDAVNARLGSLGINARIAHRLSVDDADNVTTKPLIFYLDDSTTTPTDPIINKPVTELRLKKMLKGKGFLEDGGLIPAPKDFSEKNYLPVTSLHTIMKQLIFPEAFPEEKRFRLSDDDRAFVLQKMKIRPREAGYPPEDYYDSYVKFFLYGDTKAPAPDNIISYSKAGEAYGYLTDCAYIVDKDRNKEYIITATIYVNANGIFNDDTYEYETIGIPFLAELGRQLVFKQ
ncbi:MAG: serine hydrolase [Sinomicrobium sp.]|nr:serine hydrolase [Sinomicrobium sp.]